MSTKNKNRKSINIGRFLVFSVAAMVLLAFTVKDNKVESGSANKVKQISLILESNFERTVYYDDTIPAMIFTEVEQPAQFPGGQEKWAQYIQKVITEKIGEFGEEDFGTCIVKFIVDENGKVSNVEANTMKGTLLAQVTVDAIRMGPNWIPAMQNGSKVNAYRLQPVTLTKPVESDTANNKIYTEVEKPAEFPGGARKWSQYLQKILTEKARDFDDDDYGTCIVKFIVDTKGNVSEVTATTMQGSLLASTAVSAIQKGPKWVPAMHNGEKVNAYRLQPITLIKPRK